MKKTFWVLKTALRFCGTYIIVNIFTIAIITSLSVLINVVNGKMTNELINCGTLGVLSGAFLGLVFLYLFLYFVNRANGFLRVLGHNYFSFKVNKFFHVIFMWTSSNTPQERFFDHEFLEKYSFVAGNNEKISGYIETLAGIIFGNIGAIVTSMVVFYQYAPWLILYTFFIAIGTGIIQLIVSKKEYALNKRQIKEQRFHDYYKDILTGKGCARELRIYRIKGFIYKKWKLFYEKLRLEKLSLALKKTNLFNGFSTARLLLRAGADILLIIGVFQGQYSAGTFVMLYGLLGTVTSNIGGLATSIVNGTYRDVKYLNDYYDFVCPISTRQIKELRDNFKGAKNSSLPFGDFKTLQAKGVSFSYPNTCNNGEERKAVDNVDLTIQRGEIISILGYNGSGKTTLSKLLNGSFLPSEGAILLNGVPLCEDNKAQYYEYFGNAPQEFSKFSVSIHDYIALGRMDKKEDNLELAKAYRKAGIEDMLISFEQGENTILGKAYDEKGTDLSGGQWQRLVLAASYMGEPEVLIMDEPTASIDPLKEMELIENFRNNLSGKTAILISHRIGFARIADRILMMDNGKIIESGTHEELISQNGVYARMFFEQKKLYEGNAVESQ